MSELLTNLYALYYTLYMQNKELLQRLGLSDKEAKVYLALLSMGSGSAYTIAVKSGLKRPTTYLILDELRKKGLVGKIPRAKKQLFMANPPDELLSSAEEWMQIAKRRLPELVALAAANTPNVKVLHFEGEHGLRDLLRYGRENMRGNTYSGFYAHPECYTKELFTLIAEGMRVDTEKFNISYRGIVPAHPALTPYVSGENPRYQFKSVAPDRYKSDTSIDVGDTFIRLVDVPNMQCVIIENPSFAFTLRQIFEMVWGCLPP